MRQKLNIWATIWILEKFQHYFFSWSTKKKAQQVLSYHNLIKGRENNQQWGDSFFFTNPVSKTKIKPLKKAKISHVSNLDILCKPNLRKNIFSALFGVPSIL